MPLDAECRACQETISKHLSSNQDDITENGDRQGSTFYRCVPARYMLAALSFLIAVSIYSLEVIINVTIVSMVKQPSSDVEESVEDIDRDGEFSWDRPTQGMIQSSYFCGVLATQMLGGYLAERFGGKRLVFIGLFLTGTFNILSPFAARGVGVAGFAIVRVLQGLSCGVVVPAIHSIFSLWYTPSERSKFCSIVFSGMMVGNVVGTSVPALLIKTADNVNHGWPLVFYFFGSVAVALTLPWWYIIHDFPSQHPGISADELKFIQDGLGHEDKHDKRSPVPWKKIWTSPAVWACLIIMFGLSWVAFTVLVGLPTYMKNILGYDLKKSAFFSSVPSLCQWSSSLFSGFISQWIQKKKFLTKLNTYRLFNGLAALGSAFCLITVTLVGSRYEAIVAIFAIQGFFSGTIFGGSYVNHMDIAVNFSGILAGIMQTMFSLSGMLAPVVAGVITRGEGTASQWNAVFYIASGAGIFAFLFYLVFGTVEEQPWNKPKVHENFMNAACDEQL